METHSNLTLLTTPAKAEQRYELEPPAPVVLKQPLIQCPSELCVNEAEMVRYNRVKLWDCSNEVFPSFAEISRSKFQVKVLFKWLTVGEVLSTWF